MSNPGFFATFESQAEVYELLVHDEIQEIMYWLSHDNSYRDERDAQTKTTEIVMKMPYLVSGFEVDSAANRKLFGRLFTLGD